MRLRRDTIHVEEPASCIGLLPLHRLPAKRKCTHMCSGVRCRTPSRCNSRRERSAHLFQCRNFKLQTPRSRVIDDVFELTRCRVIDPFSPHCEQTVASTSCTTTTPLPRSALNVVLPFVFFYRRRWDR